MQKLPTVLRYLQIPKEIREKNTISSLDHRSYQLRPQFWVKEQKFISHPPENKEEIAVN